MLGVRRGVAPALRTAVLSADVPISGNRNTVPNTKTLTDNVEGERAVGSDGVLRVQGKRRGSENLTVTRLQADSLNSSCVPFHSPVADSGNSAAV